MKLSELKNNPNNPRLIKDDKFEKLCNNIKSMPAMMALRPIVVDANNVVLGGNMRLKALQHLGYKDIPDEWVKQANELTPEEQRKFIILDNVSGGEWDYSILANEWDAKDLENWGLDVPAIFEMPTDDELIGEDRNKPATMKITFTSPEQLQAVQNDIQDLLDRKCKGAYFSISCGES